MKVWFYILLVCCLIPPGAASIHDARCGNQTYSRAVGVLVSPFYPFSYPDDLACTWTIYGSTTTQTIRLSFLDFAIHMDAECSRDYVEISNSRGEVIAKFCGNKNNTKVVEVGGGIVTVKFFTDDLLNDRGFAMEYRILSSQPSSSSATTTATELSTSIPTTTVDTRVYNSNGVSISGFPSFICPPSVIVADTGELTSPNYPNRYPNSVQCETTLQVSEGNVIEISFTLFDVEFQKDCMFDYFQIFDGNVQLKKLCGNSRLPDNIVTSSDVVKVIFSSDDSSRFSGFRLTWLAIQPDFQCGSKLLTANHGKLISPLYPNSYPANSNCTWLIISKLGQRIIISFEFMEIEDGDINCAYDYVEVTGNGGTVRYCGTNIPSTYESTSNNLMINFVSNAHNNLKGFSLNWKILDDQSLKPVDICSDELSEGDKGVITSPHYPSNYPSKIHCSRSILAGKGKVIRVYFDLFQLEHHASCDFDFLEIHDGMELYAGARFCSGGKPRNFIAASNNVTLVFHSDNSIGGAGFKMRWEIQDGCLSSEFTCWDGNCIPITQLCDHVKHCEDDSDEMECERTIQDYGGCGQQAISPYFTWRIFPDQDEPSHQRSRRSQESPKSEVFLSAPMHARIIGGSEARPGSWPWQVMLVDLQVNMQMCGASVISSRWLLSAAHCFTAETRVEEVEAIVGRHQTSGNAGEQHLKIVRAVFHPGFQTSGLLANDVAVLKVEPEIVFTDRVQPICLPPPHFHLSAGTICIATGWGSIYPGEVVRPKALAQVRLPLLELADCAAESRNLYDAKPLTDAHICAGDLQQGGIDTCNGDSGGPLVCLVEERRWVQVGITSFGTGCGQTRMPGIYANVERFYDWINQVAILHTTTPMSHNYSPGVDIDIDKHTALEPNFGMRLQHVHHSYSFAVSSVMLVYLLT